MAAKPRFPLRLPCLACSPATPYPDLTFAQSSIRENILVWSKRLGRGSFPRLLPNKQRFANVSGLVEVTF